MMIYYNQEIGCNLRGSCRKPTLFVDVINNFVKDFNTSMGGFFEREETFLLIKKCSFFNPKGGKGYGHWDLIIELNNGINKYTGIMEAYPSFFFKNIRFEILENKNNICNCFLENLQKNINNYLQ